MLAWFKQAFMFNYWPQLNNRKVKTMLFALFYLAFCRGKLERAFCFVISL